jgi:RNA polymerase sigma-70 factor, ECF subfamily
VQPVTAAPKPTAVSLAQGANVANLDELMVQHQAGVWRYLRALGASAGLADECTQDVFVHVHTRLSAVPRDGGAGAFLRKLAHDRYVDGQRAARRWSARQAEYAQFVTAQWAVADDAEDGGPWLRALRACVQRLDGRSRELVLAFYGEGLTREQVAERFGIGQEGVKSALARVRTSLRHCVEAKLSAAHQEEHS